MVDTHVEFAVNELNKNGYLIMPTTYESKIRGSFIVAVSANSPFTFTGL